MRKIKYAKNIYLAKGRKKRRESISQIAERVEMRYRKSWHTLLGPAKALPSFFLHKTANSEGHEKILNACQMYIFARESERQRAGGGGRNIYRW